MANIINGTDTGSGGLITTGDSSDELQLQTAETARVTLTNTAVVVNEGGNDVDFRVESDTVDHALFVEGSSGNVGIGTSSPNGDGTSLHVNGSSFATLHLTNSTTGTAVSDGFDIVMDGSDVLLRNRESAAMKFATAGAERMRIDSSGNVGIGTSSGMGFANYQVVGVGGGASAGGILQFQTAAGTDGAHIRADRSGATLNSLTVETRTSSPLLFGTNGSERMRIDSSGNLLVGTTSSGVGTPRLTSYSQAIGHALLIRSSNSGYDTCLTWNEATSGDNRFIEFGTEASYTARGTIDYNRGAGLVRYNTSSDATLKNIIGDSDGQKSIDILNSTRIREFAWKDDETQKPQIGVIAQELYETYKGAVSVGGDVEKQRDITEEVEEEYTDEEGNTQTRTVTRVTGQETYTEYRPWAVDKTAFTFHLVAGWQAHEKIIKQQAEMIAALEARIAALENA